MGRVGCGTCGTSLAQNKACQEHFASNPALWALTEHAALLMTCRSTVPLPREQRRGTGKGAERICVFHVDESSGRWIMGIVRFALRLPHTFYVLAVLVLFLGGTAIVSMPTDIFPEIDIPVVTIVWQYTGLSTPEMEQRVTTYSQYALS